MWTGRTLPVCRNIICGIYYKEKFRVDFGGEEVMEFIIAVAMAIGLFDIAMVLLLLVSVTSKESDK